ncbi:MAG TPA: fructose-6-phosphate aldolase [Planctomycetota bacterium]|jgi:transaldolase|nr:fructose-6-phosphate aldolase [Planctomycetota bacterium]
MKIFLDTASVQEIKEAARLGFLDGVTTNPTLIAREKKKFDDAIREICEICPGPVSAECVSEKFEDLMPEARRLAKLAPNVVVKIPLTREGLKAVKACAAEGIKVNVTLCFSALQAMFAAKAGAAFISPFIGRIDDTGHDGMVLIRDIVQIYRNYGYATEVLAASIRHPVHVLEAAKAGAHVATMPFAVFDKLIQHPLTDRGVQLFLEDYRKIPR